MCKAQGVWIHRLRTALVQLHPSCFSFCLDTVIALFVHILANTHCYLVSFCFETGSLSVALVVRTHYADQAGLKLKETHTNLSCYLFVND